jgi:hypothetical protein
MAVQQISNHSAFKLHVKHVTICLFSLQNLLMRLIARCFAIYQELKLTDSS